MQRRALLLSVLTIISIQSISQQPSLVIQQGHKSKILFDDFNLEQAAWLTVDDNEAFCWNIPTGRQLRRISLGSQIRGAAFVKNGEEIVLASYDLNDSRLNFYNARTGEKAGEIEFVDNSYTPVNRRKNWKVIDQLMRNRDGSRIAIRSFDKIHFVDVSQRKWLSEIRLPSYDSKFAFLSENRLIVTKLDAGRLQLIKLDSAGNVLKKTTIEKNIKPECLEIHPNLSLFAIGFKDGSIFILDEELNVQKEIVYQAGSAIADLSFNSNGSELLVSAGKTIYRYDLIKNDTSNFRGSIVPGEKIAFCPTDENNILAFHSEIPFQYNWATGKEVHAYYVNSPGMDRFFFNSKGDRMISYNMELDLRTGTSRKVFDAGYYEKILAQLSDSIIICSYKKDEYVKNEWLSQFGIEGRNTRTGKLVFQVKLPTKSPPIYADVSNDRKMIAVSDDLGGNLFLLSGERYSKVIPVKVQKGRAVRGLTFTPDGKSILAGSSNYKDSLRRYDIEKKAWSDLLNVEAPVFENHLAVTSDSRYLLFRIDNLLRPGSTELFQLGFYDLKENKIAKKFNVDEMISRIAISPKNDLFAIGFSDGHVEVYKWNDSISFLSYRAHNQFIGQLEFGKSNDWIMTRADDGFLSIWNWKQGKKVIDLFNVYSADRAFAMVTAENYYMMPPGVIREIHFAKGFQTYSVTQFDLVLNRPDKVLDRIGKAEPDLIEMYQKAIARRMRKNGVDGNLELNLDQLQPLTIENRKLIPSNTSLPVLPLKVNTANKEVNEYLLYINNQLVEKAKPLAGSWVEFKVALSEGVNNIELAYLSNKGIESLHERIEIKFQPTMPIVSKRYYIGVGVSDYAESERNLRYAAKDVQDIQEKFKKLDSSTVVNLYLDKQATKQQLLQIKELLAKTTIHDQVIISFSGHGVLDTAYNFYFATHDMNFADPAGKGFSYADIESLFDNIPARKKLILIDACQSGSVEKELFSGEGNDEVRNDSVTTYSRGGIVSGNQKNSELSSSIKLMQQYFADISKGKGAVVISASAGEENALESAEWKNGVFTFCFIQAVFEGKGDTNRDGHVSVSEVKEYMEKEVLRLTNGRQRPASRKENLEWDWWIR